MKRKSIRKQYGGLRPFRKEQFLEEIEDKINQQEQVVRDLNNMMHENEGSMSDETEKSMWLMKNLSESELQGLTTIKNFLLANVIDSNISYLEHIKDLYIELGNNLLEGAIEIFETQERVQRVPGLADFMSLIDNTVNEAYDNLLQEQTSFSRSNSLPSLSREDMMERQREIEERVRNITSQVSSKSSRRTGECETRNKTCVYMPINSEDWCDVPEEHFMGDFAGNKCFDIEEVLGAIEAALNTEKYTNRFPQIPTDFNNRQPFTIDQLIRFRNKGRQLKIKTPLLDRYLDAFFSGTLEPPSEIMHSDDNYKGNYAMKIINAIFG